MDTKLDAHHLRLEASSTCQLQCPCCPTAAGEIRKTLGSGFLSFENFKKIVDENPKILHVELSNWGEIFLNPEIIPIMKYAFDQGVSLTASNGANLNTLKEETLEAIAKYRFHHITCSIDGASSETYCLYRKGGNFEQVMQNIKSINQYKKKYDTRFPFLTWQFIVFGHNEHEIENARNLANELGMDFFVKVSWDPNFSPVQTKTRFAEGSTSIQSSTEDANYWQKVICTQLWNIPQVNWDGRVLGCCVNTWGDFGNAFIEGLNPLIHGEKMNYARQMLMGEKEAKEDIPCTSCWYYKLMQRDNSWITLKDVQSFKNPHSFPKLLGRTRAWIAKRVKTLVFLGKPFSKWLQKASLFSERPS